MQLKRENLTLIAALVLLPFIQLGASFYWSVQVVMFLLLISLLSFKDIWKTLLVGRGLVVLVLMLMSLAFQVVPDFNHAIFWIMRLFFCFIVLLTFLSQKFHTEYFNKSIEKIIVAIAFGLLGFAVLQGISFQAGSLLYIPREFYITNSGTIGNELSLRFNLVRPSATFGEPSYLGFVVLSLYVIVLMKFNDGWVKWATVLALWGAVMVCLTFSGFLSLVAVTIFYYLKKGKSLKWIVIFGSLSVLLILFGDIIFDFLPEKLSNRITGGELNPLSKRGRLFEPFSLVEHAFENYPLGMTTELLIQEVGLDAVLGRDNGFLLFLVNFGITAVYIYWLILLKVWKRPVLGVYLFMASMFNGSVFSLDKIAVMAMVTLLVGDKKIIVVKRFKGKVGVSNGKQTLVAN